MLLLVCVSVDPFAILVVFDYRLECVLSLLFFVWVCVCCLYHMRCLYWCCLVSAFVGLLSLLCSLSLSLSMFLFFLCRVLCLDSHLAEKR